jgi:iron complex transport system substrate-binding protein
MLRRLLLSIILFTVTACGAAAPQSNEAPTSTPEASTSTPEAPTATLPAPTSTPAPSVRSITDSAGRNVEIPVTIDAVISLAPSTTEIVTALNAQGNVQLLAVDVYSDYPPEIVDLPKITNYDMTVNYEQITALQPDVVFAAGITAPDVVAQVTALGIPVIVVGSVDTTFASILSDITLVGSVIGAEAEATSVVEQMQRDWDALVAEVAMYPERPTVFWELDATDPAKPYTIGPNNFVNDLLTAAGGVNIFASADNPYPQVSVEQIVAADPDVILLADSIYGVTPEMVASREGWQALAAVTNQRVYPINDSLVSRPGPRIVAGLAEVVAALHPR